MIIAARDAANVWSETLGVQVTADLILLGALLAVRAEDRDATEALLARLRPFAVA